MKKIKYLLFLLVLNFIFLILQIFVPQIRLFISELDNTFLFLLPFITFSTLGFVLLYFTKKLKLKSNLKNSLYTVGLSSGLIFIFTVIHNLIYGISMFLFNYQFEEPLFFILAVIVLPILFIFSFTISAFMIKKHNV